MFLYIDTTRDLGVEARIYDEKGILRASRQSNRDQEKGILLEHIVSLIKAADNGKVRGIIVVKGSRGRFSVIRSGVATANALAFAWNVPVAGIVQGEDIASAIQDVAHRTVFNQPVVPMYDREPNIT